MVIQKEILNAEDKTIVVFSKIENVITLGPGEIRKLSLIIELLYDKAQNEENEEKETLYGSMVDAFEEEDYFTHYKHDVQPRNLEVVQLNENRPEPFETTLIAFGYLNSKDIYLEPADLELFAEDLYWLANETDKCKEETKTFILNLADNFKKELKEIENNSKNNSLDVEGL